LHAVALFRWRAGAGERRRRKSGCPGASALSRRGFLGSAGSRTGGRSVPALWAPYRHSGRLNHRDGGSGAQSGERGAGAAAAADIHCPPVRITLISSRFCKRDAVNGPWAPVWRISRPGASRDRGYSTRGRPGMSAHAGARPRYPSSVLPLAPRSTRIARGQPAEPTLPQSRERDRPALRRGHDPRFAGDWCETPTARSYPTASDGRKSGPGMRPTGAGDGRPRRGSRGRWRRSRSRRVRRRPGSRSRGHRTSRRRPPWSPSGLRHGLGSRAQA
jgi:hypothetical protein